MSRCACRALERLLDDPRMRTLPLAARGFVLMLAHAMQRLPNPAVLAWGDMIPGAAEIALMVSASETEVETHLKTLRETGLITQSETGAVQFSGTVSPQARPRRGVGGRPKSGESREDYSRRQREMRLFSAMPGGRAPAAPDVAKTPAETPARVSLAADSSVGEKEAKLAAGNVGELAAQLADLAGLDPAHAVSDAGVVKGWLAQGATAALLIGVVERVAARPKYQIPEHLGYFRGAVADALREAAAARVTGARPADGALQAAKRQWMADVERWREQGCYGDAPQPPHAIRQVA